MNTDLQSIKAALVTADEKPPLAPYTPLKKAPPKFPYGEKTLTPPDDARTVIPTLEALNGRAERLQLIEDQAKSMRVEVEEKIAVFKNEEGYESIAQEMTVLKERLAGEVEQVIDRIGDTIIIYNDIVLSIIEQTTKGTATLTEVQTALIDKIKEFASPAVAGKIISGADEVIKAAAEAKDKIQRRLVSFPASQDIRKKVKQELPKGGSKKIALVEKLKEFATGLLETMKSAWNNLSDKLSSLLSITDSAKPLMDEIKQLADEAGFTSIQASKYSGNNSDIIKIKAALN